MEVEVNSTGQGSINFRHAPLQFQQIAELWGRFRRNEQIEIKPLRWRIHWVWIVHYLDCPIGSTATCAWHDFSNNVEKHGLRKFTISQTIESQKMRNPGLAIVVLSSLSIFLGSCFLGTQATDLFVDPRQFWVARCDFSSPPDCKLWCCFLT